MDAELRQRFAGSARAFQISTTFSARVFTTASIAAAEASAPGPGWWEKRLVYFAIRAGVNNDDLPSHYARRCASKFCAVRSLAIFPSNSRLAGVMWDRCH
jgi:hypothetical protein